MRAIGELLRVDDVPVGHRSQAQLLGREPERERTGVVLGEHREEPLDGTEERAVDHDRAVAFPVVARVMQVEALRQLVSTWIVDICQVRPIASLACTEILGP